MKDLFEILDAMLARKAEAPDPKELYLDLTERIAKSISAEFGAKNDEVAILIATSDASHLRFVAPRKLASLGTIPLSKRDSIAVNTFSRKQAEAVNNVPLVKHVAFFESVKLRESPAPIQKMVSVPVIHAGQTLGVVQISRKGESPRDAGPDFSQADVRKASDLCASVARYLAEARPDPF